MSEIKVDLVKGNDAAVVEVKMSGKGSHTNIRKVIDPKAGTCSYFVPKDIWEAWKGVMGNKPAKKKAKKEEKKEIEVNTVKDPEEIPET